MQNPTHPPPNLPEMPSTTPLFSPELPEIPSTITTTTDDLTNPSSSLFDWSDFLDFSLDDDGLPITFADHGHHDNSSIPITDIQPRPEPEPEPEPKPRSSGTQQEQVVDAGRVRKRDPRMVCSNFLAGRIPCACPELDAKLMEEEMEVANAGKKRARVARGAGGTGVMLRCQVPGCEADISELKGYHKRHRVCLRCATASYVVLDGESKRYCQQCGKFHILPDFDEGKRSCRRKLERHNTRRRRKPADSKGTAEKEHEPVVLTENLSYGDDTGKDAEGRCLGSEIAEREIQIEAEGQLSTLYSAHSSQIMQSDVSYTASGEAPIDIEKENLKDNHSPSYDDNKSAFSSVCPTGRISFKLYDWNPAEFPRRLRHQIFQWLSSMPVELEGYIRPGCTIFTVYISMPKFMWDKLIKDPAPCLHNFIFSPGNMLYGKGTLLVYLNNMIYCVKKGGTSVMKVKVKEMTPKLHYIHPTCFEAGKPMEFVACGSNLLQPKFRFLLSFSGKYLACDYFISPLRGTTEDGTKSADHQLVKIHVPQTESDLFGPAFIEVENESGLSNFIPILIGDKEICAEMKIMQQRLDASLSSQTPEFAASDSSCEVSILKQVRLSQFISDVAWSLRDPVLENMETAATFQVQRLNHLTKFLMENDSIAILERVLRCMNILVDSNLLAGVSDVDMRLFQNNMDIARNILSQKQPEDLSVMLSRKLMPGGSSSQTSRSNMPPVLPATSQGLEVGEKSNMDARMDLSSLNESTTVPLLNREVVMSVNVKHWPGKSSSRFLTGSLLTNRPVICVIASAAVCFGLCAVLLHPQKVQIVATTIRSCLFDNS